jgi:hypothetical protein
MQYTFRHFLYVILKDYMQERTLVALRAEQLN